MHEVLGEEVLDEQEARQQRQGQQHEAAEDRTEHRRFKSFHGWQGGEQAQWAALAQASTLRGKQQHEYGRYRQQACGQCRQQDVGDEFRAGRSLFRIGPMGGRTRSQDGSPEPKRH